MNTFTELHYQYAHIYTYTPIHTHYIYIHVWNHETMSPSGYHDNGFVATHALGHMMYSFTLLIAITIYIYMSCYVYEYLKTAKLVELHGILIWIYMVDQFCIVAKANLK